MFKSKNKSNSSEMRTLLSLLIFTLCLIHLGKCRNIHKHHKINKVLKSRHSEPEGLLSAERVVGEPEPEGERATQDKDQEKTGMRIHPMF